MAVVNKGDRDEKDPRGLFGQYRDGELDPGQLEEFEAHMAGCGECRTKGSQFTV